MPTLQQLTEQKNNEISKIETSLVVTESAEFSAYIDEAKANGWKVETDSEKKLMYACFLLDKYSLFDIKPNSKKVSSTEDCYKALQEEAINIWGDMYVNDTFEEETAEKAIAYITSYNNVLEKYVAGEKEIAEEAKKQQEQAAKEEADRIKQQEQEEKNRIALEEEKKRLEPINIRIRHRNRFRNPQLETGATKYGFVKEKTAWDSINGILKEDIKVINPNKTFGKDKESYQDFLKTAQDTYGYAINDKEERNLLNAVFNLMPPDTNVFSDSSLGFYYGQQNTLQRVLDNVDINKLNDEEKKSYDYIKAELGLFEYEGTEFFPVYKNENKVLIERAEIEGALFPKFSGLVETLSQKIDVLKADKKILGDDHGLEYFKQIALKNRWDIVKEDSLTNAIFNLIPENEAGDEFVKYFQSKVIDNSRDKKEVLEKAVELANGRNLSPEEQNSLAYINASLNVLKPVINTLNDIDNAKDNPNKLKEIQDDLDKKISDYKKVEDEQNQQIRLREEQEKEAARQKKIYDDKYNALVSRYNNVNDSLFFYDFIELQRKIDNNTADPLDVKVMDDFLKKEIDAEGWKKLQRDSKAFILSAYVNVLNDHDTFNDKNDKIFDNFKNKTELIKAAKKDIVDRKEAKYLPRILNYKPENIVLPSDEDVTKGLMKRIFNDVKAELNEVQAIDTSVLLEEGIVIDPFAGKEVTVSEEALNKAKETKQRKDNVEETASEFENLAFLKENILNALCEYRTQLIYTQEDRMSNFYPGEDGKIKKEGSDLYKDMTASLKDAIDTLQNDDSKFMKIIEKLEILQQKSKVYHKERKGIIFGPRNDKGKERLSISGDMSERTDKFVDLFHYQLQKATDASEKVGGSMRLFSNDTVSKMRNMEAQGIASVGYIDTVALAKDAKKSADKNVLQIDRRLFCKELAKRNIYFDAKKIKEFNPHITRDPYFAAKHFLTKKYIDYIFSKNVNSQNVRDLKLKLSEEKFEKDVEKLSKNGFLKDMLKKHPNSWCTKWKEVDRISEELQAANEDKILTFENNHHGSLTQYVMNNNKDSMTKKAMITSNIAEVLTAQILSDPANDTMRAAVALKPETENELKESIKKYSERLFKFDKQDLSADVKKVIDSNKIKSEALKNYNEAQTAKKRNANKTKQRANVQQINKK